MLKRFEQLQSESAFKGKLAGSFAKNTNQTILSEQRGLRLFERLRVILEFFATATGNAEHTSNMLMVSTIYKLKYF